MQPQKGGKRKLASSTSPFLDGCVCLCVFSLFVPDQLALCALALQNAAFAGVKPPQLAYDTSYTFERVYTDTTQHTHTKNNDTTQEAMSCGTDDPRRCSRCCFFFLLISCLCLLRVVWLTPALPPSEPHWPCPPPESLSPPEHGDDQQPV
jgi:hypothetical protein